MKFDTSTGTKEVLAEVYRLHLEAAISIALEYGVITQEEGDAIRKYNLAEAQDEAESEQDES